MENENSRGHLVSSALDFAEVGCECHRWILTLSVVIPAYYNEAERIVPTLQRISDYLGRRFRSSEIVVVLDGPSDSTRDVLRGILCDIPHLKVIDRLVNRGKGFTVREGMLRATGRIRLFTDADNSTDIAHFERMQPLFDNGYDLVNCFAKLQRHCHRRRGGFPGLVQALDWAAW